jgi:hypothetical protein
MKLKINDETDLLDDLPTTQPYCRIALDETAGTLKRVGTTALSNHNKFLSLSAEAWFLGTLEFQFTNMPCRSSC